MSDQSLRDAQLRQEYRAEIMRGYQAALCNSDIPGWTLGDEVAKVADKLLAAHPAEPAPVVTDQAVEDLHARVVTEFRRHGQYTLADARTALEATAPLLGPRPLLDRDKVSRAFRSAAGPWLTANRDAVTDAATDAVMALARPMPTREEIDALLQEWRVGPAFQPPDPDRPNALANYRRKLRNGLLALLNGGAK